MENLKINFNLSGVNQKASIKLEGCLQSIDAILFKTTILRLITETSEDITLDISKLDNIDLAGMNALAIAQSRMQKYMRSLNIIARAKGPVRDLLHLTKFDNLLSVNYQAN